MSGIRPQQGMLEGNIKERKLGRKDTNEKSAVVQ